jgi:serine phosphatase RsbU (regulator of sigma subunit)
MEYLSKKQLKLWLPLLMLVPLWSGSFLAARLGERALIEDVHERLVLALHANEAYLHTVLDDQERNLTLYLAGAIMNRSPGSKVPRFGWDYMSRYVPEAMGCLAFDLQGRLVAHTEGPGHPPPFEVIGEVPVNLTEGSVTDPTTDPTDPSSRSFYDIFLPLIISDDRSYGSVSGTLVCRLTNILSQALTQYRQELGLTGDVYLVSAKTRLMLTESRSIPTVVGRMMVDTVGVRQALKEGGGQAFYSDYRGIPVMGAFLMLPQYSWILLAEMAEDEAMGSVYRLRMVLGISVGLVSLAASLVGWRYGRQLEEKERIASELRIARDIQRSILPRRFPPFPERDEFELYAETLPARETGGDFFDFFFIDHERLALVIADVSGKSTPAAIFMAVTRTMLKATAMQAASPGECLHRVNNLLCPDNDATMFVTVFYAILNTRTGELEYSNAGHNLPYLLSGQGKIAVLDGPGGMALGVVQNSPYQVTRIRLHPREGLFLYTDGVTEAMDHQGDLFSDSRLKHLLLRIQGDSPDEIVRQTIAEVRGYAAGEPQSDDITVLALRYLHRTPDS